MALVAIANPGALWIEFSNHTKSFGSNGSSDTTSSTGTPVFKSIETIVTCFSFSSGDISGRPHSRMSGVLPSMRCGSSTRNPSTRMATSSARRTPLLSTGRCRTRLYQWRPWRCPPVRPARKWRVAGLRILRGYNLGPGLSVLVVVAGTLAARFGLISGLAQPMRLGYTLTSVEE